ncbi:MAG: GDSL-type esterase/lipase family protein [Oscillospiraceae bacterium]|jgi:lysophospholipase L1-like esterase|nr:GDSL-type esterase/lipase family protein [Oscillospiraceae bacterium]
MIKKSIAVFLVALLFLFSFGGLIAFAADETTTETTTKAPEPPKMKYVVLGDSIAEGVGADPLGIITGYKNGFANKVVAKKDYELKNHAKSAKTSEDVLTDVKSNTDIRNDIKTASVISISIGGNDVMGDNLLSVAVQTLINKPDKVNEIVHDLRFNLLVIMTRIKELNPNAVIFVQTLYNPMSGSLKDMYQTVVDKVNPVFAEYLEKYPGAYYLLDLQKAFNGESKYIAFDMTHPSKEGHVKIAEMIVEQLDQLEKAGKLARSGKNQFDTDESTTTTASGGGNNTTTTTSSEQTTFPTSIPRTGDDSARVLYLLIPMAFLGAAGCIAARKKPKTAK